MFQRLFPSLLVIFAAAVCAERAHASETAEMLQIPLDGTIRIVDGIFTALQPVEPVQPVQPVQPIQPIEPGLVTTASVFGGLLDLDLLPPERQADAGGAASDVIFGSEASVRNTTDSGDLLDRSASSTNVYSHSRSPISHDPRIRGYRYGQIQSHANGASWVPVRPDLDTPLSRIDSSIIRDIIIIKGPYSVRHGPGFGFIDIELFDTPRYFNGGCWGGRTALSYDTNGEQWYGRQTFWGGSSDQGYRIGYGHRVGSDYQTGADIDVAAGYNIRDWDFAYGLDLSPNSSVEFGYIRNDLTDVEMPSQYNDIDFLVTDGFTLRYVLEDQCYFDRLKVDTWYNQSRFAGTLGHKQIGRNQNGQHDNEKGNLNPYIPGLSKTGFSETFGDNHSTGYRAVMSWGCLGDAQAAVGTDFTFLKQEYLSTDPVFLAPEFGLPRSSHADTGLFADAVAPLGCWTLKTGARLDWVATRASQAGVGLLSPPVMTTGSDPLATSQSFLLGAGYLTGEYELTDTLTGVVGYGVAQRSPTLTDLYADSPFLSVTQLGGVFVPLGNTGLVKETSQQLDVGLRVESCDFRGGIHGFYAWIDDFITYVPDLALDPIERRIHSTLNQDATLSGAEIYGEYDASEAVVLFASLSYVEGQDRTTNVPLWSIYPLDSIVGMRVQQISDFPRWGVEMAVRIVDNQGRFNSNPLASLVEQPTPGFTTVDLIGYWRIGDRTTLYTGVENLGNRNYQEHLDSRVDLNLLNPGGVFRPGTNYYVMLESVY